MGRRNARGMHERTENMAGKAGHRGWGTLRRLPSGRWQASYVGPDLARHNAPTTYGGRMDAEAWLAGERRLIERQEWTAPTVRAAAQTSRGISVADYIESWITQRANLSESTRYGYENNLRKHIAGKPLGRLPLSAVTPEAVRSWFATMDAAKPTARAAVYSMLRTACNTATADGVFTRNPAIIAGASTQSTARQPVILTVPELAQLADGVGERLRAWVLIAGWCGLRVGEALELRRSDISDDYTVISVSRGHRHIGGKCIIKSTKSGKPRSVVIPPHIRADVKHHLDVHTGKAADALLFANPTGKCHLGDDLLRNAMAPTLARIGKPTMVIHDLRHTCGTLTARCGDLVETAVRRLRLCTAPQRTDAVWPAQRQNPDSVDRSRQSTRMDRQLCCRDDLFRTGVVADEMPTHGKCHGTVREVMRRGI